MIEPSVRVLSLFMIGSRPEDNDIGIIYYASAGKQVAVIAYQSKAYRLPLYLGVFQVAVNLVLRYALRTVYIFRSSASDHRVTLTRTPDLLSLSCTLQTYNLPN